MRIGHKIPRNDALHNCVNFQYFENVTAIPRKCSVLNFDWIKWFTCNVLSVIYGRKLTGDDTLLACHRVFER